MIAITTEQHTQYSTDGGGLNAAVISTIMRSTECLSILHPSQELPAADTPNVNNASTPNPLLDGPSRPPQVPAQTAPLRQ